MVSGLAARHALSKEVVEGVTERTGGVPLFVEELTRLLLERGEQGGIQAIPPTLQQSLTARLDRLGSAREVAQIGAVIGRDFSYKLIRSVAAIEDAPLQTALERLAEADILLVQGLPPESEYRFKHALIQDAAYENLLKSRRQVLHRCIAEALHEEFTKSGRVEPELLAHHFTQAGLIDAAIAWWGRAGQHSLDRSALVEAVEQFTRALGLIADLPSTPALRRAEIKLRVALLTPLTHIKGYGAPETKVAAERARLLIENAEELGEPLDDPLLLLSVFYSFWVANYYLFDGNALRELALQFLTLAEKQRSQVPLMIGHRLMSVSLIATGDFAQGRAHCERAMALYHSDKHRSLMTRFGQDTAVTILSQRSLAQWYLGYPEAALADAIHALKEARAIGQAATLMYALHYTSWTFFHCGDFTTATAGLEELVALAAEKGSLQWKVRGMASQSCILALIGTAPGAVQVLTAGIAAQESMAAGSWMPIALSVLALAYAKLNEFDDAWRCIDEAIRMMERTQERAYEAEVRRISGDIALKLPEPHQGKAEAFFQRSLAVARQQQAKSWELRAAMSMARLWRDQGKREEARELLAPVYGWFTEGFDTRDLKEAKGLLDELAA